MFETAEIGSRIDRETYRADVPDVRSALLEVQRELAQSRVSAVVIVGGSEGAGKESAVGLLLAWLAVVLATVGYLSLRVSQSRATLCNVWVSSHPS